MPATFDLGRVKTRSVAAILDGRHIARFGPNCGSFQPYKSSKMFSVKCPSGQRKSEKGLLGAVGHRPHAGHV